MIGLMNGQEAPESGLRLKAPVAPSAVVPRRRSKQVGDVTAAKSMIDRTAIDKPGRGALG